MKKCLRNVIVSNYLESNKDDNNITNMSNCFFGREIIYTAKRSCLLLYFRIKIVECLKNKKRIIATET